MFRKTALTALAAATFSAAALIGANSASAYGYGYYSGGNGYYGYYGNYCRYIKVPYKWDYYGRPIAWRTIKYCG
jgi:hypothetical protein